MIVYGYAKNSKYGADRCFQVQVRIPSIHGPYNQSDAKGKSIHNYVKDEDLPWYPALVTSYLPSDGDVVALINTNNSDINADFFVLGFTGATYNSNQK